MILVEVELFLVEVELVLVEVELFLIEVELFGRDERYFMYLKQVNGFYLLS